MILQCSQGNMIPFCSAMVPRTTTWLQNQSKLQNQKKKGIQHGITYFFQLAIEKTLLAID